MASLLHEKPYALLKAKSGHSVTRHEGSLRIPPSLLSLPLEVIIMVMAELDCIEFVRARRTCRSIYAASQSRQLWLRIYEKLSLEYDYPLPFAKYIDQMTTSELEKSSTDWLRFEIGWLSKDRPPQRRSIGHYTEEDSAHLIEGGQWLLTFNKYGCGPIYAYYLDAPARPKTKLLELSTPCTRLKLSIQVLATFPHLEFVLAFLCDVTFNGPVRLEIWKVVASDAAHGPVLSASLLTSFATRLDIYSSKDLRGNLFVGEVSTRRLDYISIIDWPRSSGLALCEAAIYPIAIVRIIKLLPDGRIVTIGSRGAYIYQHAPCSYDALPDSSWGLVTSPICSLALPYTVLTRDVTPPYTDYAGTTRVLFGTNKGIMQVSIPEHYEDAQMSLSLPLPHCLYHFDRYRMVARYRSVAGSGWAAFTACMRRPDVVQFNVPPLDWPSMAGKGFNPCQLDAASGRIVEFDEKDCIIVVDYKL